MSLPILSDLSAQLSYPGRFLILGRNDRGVFAVYGVTARSTANPAKRYVLSESQQSIFVQPVDKATWHHPNLDLLDYTAVHFFDNGLVIGNGRQTDRVTLLDNTDPALVLEHALASETFEPDKYSTPRITGCIVRSSGGWRAALHRIRDDGAGNSLREVFLVSLGSEHAQFICTYAGPNIRPTPSFTRSPIELTSAGLKGTVERIAEQVYDAFAPAPSTDDLRVSVVAILLPHDGGVKQIHILNSVDK